MELRYCEKCNQMTNHNKESGCLKCLNTPNSTNKEDNK